MNKYGYNGYNTPTRWKTHAQVEEETMRSRFYDLASSMLPDDSSARFHLYESRFDKLRILIERQDRETRAKLYLKLDALMNELQGH